MGGGIDLAQQIAHPNRGVPNFKRPIRERFKKEPSARERREGNDPMHRKLVKLLPCCITGKLPPNDAHHLCSGPAVKERGTAMKATDRWLVPLCRELHDEVGRIGTRNEIAWFLSHGVDPHELARALWQARGDLAAMTRIVRAHMTVVPR